MCLENVNCVTRKVLIVCASIHMHIVSVCVCVCVLSKKDSRQEQCNPGESVQGWELALKHGVCL